MENQKKQLQESFGDVIRDLLTNVYETDYAKFVSDHKVGYNTVKQWVKTETQPLREILDKLLTSEFIPNEYKKRMAHAVAAKVWETQKEYNPKGRSRGLTTLQGLLELESIPSAVRRVWETELYQHKNPKALNPEGFENKKSFGKILEQYVKEDENPTLPKFIQKLYNEWKMPSASRLASVINYSQSEISLCLTCAQETPDQHKILKVTTIENILNSPAVFADHRAKQLFYKLAKNLLQKKELVPPSIENYHRAVTNELENKLDLYAQKLQSAASHREKESVAAELFRDLARTSGYTEKYISLKTDLKLSAIKCYYSKDDNLFGGIKAAHPDYAFRCAYALIPHNKRLANTCASIFLHVCTYHSKEALAASLLNGETSINQAFLETRLLIQKQTLTDFAKSFGSTPYTLSRIEKGEAAWVEAGLAFTFATKYLGIGKKEDLTLYRDRLVDTMKNNKVGAGYIRIFERDFNTKAQQHSPGSQPSAKRAIENILTRDERPKTGTGLTI